MQSGPACPDVDLQAGQRWRAELPVGHVRCPGGNYPRNYDADEGSWHTDGSSPVLTLLRNVTSCVPALASAWAAHPAELPPKPLAWHSSQPLLAAVDSTDGVQVFDFTEHMPYLGQVQPALPPPLPPAFLLRHKLQCGAAALAWRPNGGKTLAVGCAHGACVWHLGRTGSAQQGGTAGGASLVWLQAPEGQAVTTLSWHPSGHLLAAASQHRPGLHVWDVATGAVTSVRVSHCPRGVLSERVEM